MGKDFCVTSCTNREKRYYLLLFVKIRVIRDELFFAYLHQCTSLSVSKK